MQHNTHDWNVQVCPSEWCRAEAWLVQQSPASPDLWRITDQNGGRSWQIAATEPICPRCGTTLHTAAELDMAIEVGYGAVEQLVGI